MNRSRAARRRENTNRAERYKPDTGSGQHILLQVNKSQQTCCAREVKSNRVEISAGSGHAEPDQGQGHRKKFLMLLFKTPRPFAAREILKTIFSVPAPGPGRGPGPAQLGRVHVLQLCRV